MNESTIRNDFKPHLMRQIYKKLWLDLDGRVGRTVCTERNLLPLENKKSSISILIALKFIYPAVVGNVRRVFKRGNFPPRVMKPLQQIFERNDAMGTN